MGCTDKVCKNCSKWHSTYECPMAYIEQKNIIEEQSCLSYIVDNTKEDGLGYCDRFAPETVEKMITPIEWIDIKDELPSNGARVLVTVCYDTGDDLPYIYTDVGMRCEEYWFVDNELNDNVTHWAKLPQPAERNRA